MKQTVRIIGGQWRGKKIQFPTVHAIRPTPDRVRETLFNWLMHDIQGARCLDAFAGSGALGLEALSRGAGQVTLLEKTPEVYRYLKQLAPSFNSTKLHVIQADACHFLQHSTLSFDIIFLDPPFASHYLSTCIDLLCHSSLLVSQGLLYVESPNQIALDPANWEVLKFKQTGAVCYGLYRKIIA